jgi:inosine-uridine nucleoside N-ribohydrolase
MSKVSSLAKAFYLLVMGIAAAAGSEKSIAADAVAVPVIIDTDIGDDIDDAFALALAVSDSRINVVGVTTAWGDTHTRTLLVRRLLAAAGRSDIPVAEGLPTPNKVAFTQRPWAMGASDQGPAESAVAFIGAAARRDPGHIVLLSLAPAVNIQQLLVQDPQGAHLLREVVAMGGSIHAGYRSAGVIPPEHPSAEYNVAVAPDAFRALLESGLRVTLFPLDSTQIGLQELDRDRLFGYGSALTDSLTLLYHQWRLRNEWGQLTPTLFDVVPLNWVIDPSSCHPEPMHVAVDALGYTRSQSGAPNAGVCLTVQGSGVTDRVMRDLTVTAARTGPP